MTPERRESLIHNALRAAVIALEGGRVTRDDFPQATAAEYRDLVAQLGQEATA
jgi:hypothetical protein